MNNDDLITKYVLLGALAISVCVLAGLLIQCGFYANKLKLASAELEATRDNLAHAKEQHAECEVLLVDKAYQTYSLYGSFNASSYQNATLCMNTFCPDCNDSTCKNGLYGEKICKADEYAKEYSNGLCDCKKKNEVN